MSSATLTCEEASRHHWDFIVIGTGMAGATVGYELARNGKQVLFCEKGRSLLAPQTGLRGEYAETFFKPAAAPGTQHRNTLLQAGRYADTVTDTGKAKPRATVPFIGCGTGGSSALYGAALERFFPEDFTPRRNHPNATETTLPEQWPVSYEEMQPYYTRAEALFRTRGSADPLRPDSADSHILSPPPLRQVSEELHERFKKSGLHPYRLPQACEFVANCQGCQGYLCPNDCKNDSTRICLRPALEQHGAHLLDDCEADRLISDGTTVTAVVCKHDNQEVTLRGAVIILAAGALETPRLLLNSADNNHPNGLANGSGLVGRNLMRHYVDLYALLPKTRQGHPGNLKELALSDFYHQDAHKLGTVQSFGALPPPAVITEEVGSDLSMTPFHWLVPFFNLGKPVTRYVVKKIFSRRVLFASIMEDLPYAHNRVRLPAAGDARDGTRLLIEYRISPYEQARIRLFRKLLKQAFKPFNALLLKQAENNLRLAHVCGTCRFGNDPETSVLNNMNRAHQLDNLYVVDASFFPSSGGTNPALTLAANALRVADHIVQNNNGVDKQPETNS